jgi:hypothetical protein
MVAWALAADFGVGAARAEAVAPAAGKATSTAGAGRLTPMLLGTGDMKVTGTRADETTSAGRPLITFDAKSHTVWAPVRFTRAKGVVEWILSSHKRHPGSSVMLSENWASDFAAAFARAGYVAGAPPLVFGDDRVRMPAGQPVAVDVIVTHADGKTDRTPASKFLSARLSGEPVGEGTWIYVGPQSIRDGDDEMLVTELSGSIATTNVRDTSAMIFWMPKGGDASASIAPTYYAATTALPSETDRCEIEIQPVGPMLPAVKPVAMPTATATPTAAAKVLPVPTPTVSPTPTAVPVLPIPTPTATPTPTVVPSLPVPMPTVSPTPTAVPVLAVPTANGFRPAASSDSMAATPTPSPTPTAVLPLPPPTPTPVPTPTAAPPLPIPTPTVSPTPTAAASSASSDASAHGFRPAAASGLPTEMTASSSVPTAADSPAVRPLLQYRLRP